METSNSQAMNLSSFFLDNPVANNTADNKSYRKLNNLILRAFRDVLTAGKVSQLRRNTLNEIQDLTAKEFCQRTFDLLDACAVEGKESFRFNLTDFGLFYTNTASGKKLQEKVLKNSKILNYPLLVSTFNKDGFSFANSQLFDAFDKLGQETTQAPEITQ